MLVVGLLQTCGRVIWRIGIVVVPVLVSMVPVSMVLGDKWTCEVTHHEGGLQKHDMTKLGTFHQAPSCTPVLWFIVDLQVYLATSIARNQLSML